VSPTTYREEERKYRYLATLFQELKEKGRIGSTDPRQLQRGEVQEFLSWMKERGLNPSYQEKLIGLLNAFLKFFKNFSIEEMKSEGIRFPKAPKKPVRVIEHQDLAEIFSTAKKMTGWRGILARGMVGLYFATGIRPKELRLALIQDVDIAKRRFYVRHPKGEHSWASPQWISMIREDVIPFIERFLVERGEYIDGKELKNPKALFPSLDHRSKDGFYSHNGFRRIKSKIEELSGVDFQMKDFRSTLASMTVNGDLSRIPLVSEQLRHSKIETTRKFYTRIEAGSAGKRLRDIWMENPVVMHENPVIREKFDLTGYG